MFPSLATFLARTEVWMGGSALAAFLVLYWALRGAPPGQTPATEDDEEAPRSGYRDRVVAAVVVGLLLILGGGSLALTRGLLWSIPVFGLGFGLVLALVMVNRRYRHSSPSLRRTIEFSNTVLNAALLAGILIVANVIAFRYGGLGIDLTRERTYSLSSLTLNQVESLQRPVVFHLAYGGGPLAVRRLDRVAQLLDLYRAANPGMIKVDSLNPYTELARGGDLAQKVPDLAVLQGGGVLIEYGAGSDAEFSMVSSQEMFEPINRGRAGFDRYESTFRGEDAITAALIRLREARKAKVGFTTGHGEASTSDLNPNSPGIGLWRARLASIGCEPIDLNLLQDAIPEDLALLIIAGPRSPFKAEEVAQLKAYTDRGGPVLALVGDREATGLDDFLRSFNLEISRGLIVDPQLNWNRNPSFVYTFLKGGPGHPVTDALDPNRAVLIPNGAPIHILGQSTPGQPAATPVNANLLPTAILRTAPQSWAETDPLNPPVKFDKGTDQAGPLTVGVAVQERAPRTVPSPPSPRPRLVLFASRFLASNFALGIEPTNLDLVMNAASWLRGRPDVVGIAPKTHVALTLTADPLLRSRLILVPTVMAVMGIIALGIIVYVARRE